MLIDNYDSFTYNLAHMLLTGGCHVEIVRNDQVSADQVAAFAPARIVISPGPGTPADAGISVDVVRVSDRTARRQIGGLVRVFFDLPIALCSCRQGTGSGMPVAQAAVLRCLAAGCLNGRMTTEQEVTRVVSASREIAAGPGRIFELIADPAAAASLGRERQPGRRTRRAARAPRG